MVSGRAVLYGLLVAGVASCGGGGTALQRPAPAPARVLVIGHFIGLNVIQANGENAGQPVPTIDGVNPDVLQGLFGLTAADDPGPNCSDVYGIDLPNMAAKDPAGRLWVLYKKNLDIMERHAVKPLGRRRPSKAQCFTDRQSDWVVYPQTATPGVDPPAYRGTGEALAMKAGPAGLVIEVNDPRAVGYFALRTYAYGGDPRTPIHTFTVPPGSVFALGPDGTIYVPAAAGFNVYASDSNGCCPLKTIATHGGLQGREFVVGSDGEIYVVEVDDAYSLAYTSPFNFFVSVYAPDTGTLVRRFGPVLGHNGIREGFGIDVDARRNIYVSHAETLDDVFVFSMEGKSSAPSHTFRNSALWNGAGNVMTLTALP